jgi:carboxyl-terminal processing protease
MNKFKKNIFILIFILTFGALIYSSDQTETIYSKLKLFTEIFTLIKNNYVSDVDLEKLVYGAANGMVKTLDPFSQFLPPSDYKEMQIHTEGSFGGVGIRISVKDDFLVVITPLPGTPAYKAGILPGDKIVKIDTETVKGFTMDDTVKRLRGKPGTEVTLTVSRDGVKDPIDYKLVRELIKIETVTSKLLDDGIGYIHILEFTANTNEDFEKEFSSLEAKNIKGLVLDLRNNPGGLLTSAVDICKYFIGDNKLIVYTQGRDSAQKLEYRADKNAKHRYLSLVVLVNQGSASGAEIVAGAMKDLKRAVIVGAKTFGKGSVQTVIGLSDGSALRLTTAKYYTPNGTCIHDIGIEPDVPIDISKEQLQKIMMQEDKIYNKKDEEKKNKIEQKDEKKEDKKEIVDDPQLKAAIGILKSRDVFNNSVK